MRLADFNYELPEGLIAQLPLSERDSARLMVIDRASGDIGERVFRDILEYLNTGDCLVINDTRVVPARLYGRRKTGGKVEIFLINTDQERPCALINPSRRVNEGERIDLEGGARVTVLGRAKAGRFVEFDAPLREVLGSGHMPLPPYISRDDTFRDRSDYQTVYAARDGATAAPTAGLHFTRSLLEATMAKGVNVATVTLHTSYGSFAPVSVDAVEEHKMHSEYFEFTSEAASVINLTKKNGGKVVAVGTTSARVLETVAVDKGHVEARSGETDLFIYPGYELKIIDGIVTNFHLPKSTLLMLVAAFAGRDLTFKAYHRAIDLKYRFFSYGDAMLVL
ncbi:MAG: tRNA preQ1(34) S-adenosylmethionine ribosyltransferase-isomerase QueA [Candidatus Omnitrophica bacterium]|nr:tRNA preQ1(34) S-adenosylmethionine ribosyltransferase-isomerase QueA [Candidatus Omnitrophota bacterium]MBU1128609.1 tRNA preQ1(34) S-adenosylmethionine ribosyltransferase-isomerase QueA [Candidatus Omnitrophota bacterium]MBU1784375.1 tRNA preQ1(34) S-adenosylmethionine ribosyltransferase-isomerase QueA [Candidatus Omnitrophota bacterium]MBU1852178.1 tRNA preQ1(34) S-adenosylmethionine ribosyltransferase-isomerase QueA [Candidatus Omnitrophota bacterium]